MEYLTLLDYLYTISYTHRNKAIQAMKHPAFFLPNHLTVLNKIDSLK